MWSTPSDRALAAQAERRALDEREQARTPTMTVEDRIERWRTQEGGRETEGYIDLLADAEDELRRLRAQVEVA